MPSSIHWPAVLPAPSPDSHGYTNRSASLGTSFGISSRSRQIYSDASAELQLMFMLSASQWAYFEGWYRYVLKDGTLWFWLPVVVAGVREEREVSFMGQPCPAQLAGRNYGRVTASVVTRKGTAMDADTWEVIEEVGSMDGYAALLQALELFVNQDGLAPLE